MAEPTQNPWRKPEKRCTHCGEWLPSERFPRNKHTRDELSSWCRACHYEASQRSRRKRRERERRKETTT